MFGNLSHTYGDEIVLIHNTHNGGYGQGNNVGIRRASAPVVLVMNPDVRLSEPIFKIAVEAFEEDQKLCMYGMRQMLSEKVKSPISFDCSRRMNGYIIPVLTALGNKLNCYLSRWMYFQGSCFFVRKDMFMEVGLFDEDIFMYGEEDDIHWRLSTRFGTHFRFNPRLSYIHLTLTRPMSLDTEKRMVESIVLSNKKKGVEERWTIKNFIRYYRMRYFTRMLTGRRNACETGMLKVLIGELKQMA
jgi:GT2 family glycosyltransferase